MFATAGIVCLLLLPSMALAEDDTRTGVNLSWFYAYTFGVIFVSVLITLIIIGFAYLLLFYVKKRRVQPEYYIECPSVSKAISDESTASEVQQIEPILTVSEVVSSVKESLEHLGNTLLSSRHRHEEKSIVHF